MTLEPDFTQNPEVAEFLSSSMAGKNTNNSQEESQPVLVPQMTSKATAAAQTSRRSQHPRLPCILLGTTSPSFSLGNYGLCILGERDGDGKTYTKNKTKKAASTSLSLLENEQQSTTTNTMMMVVVKAPGSAESTAALLVPYDADHSLRIPTKQNPTDKDASTLSEETKRLSLQLARKVHEFVVSYCHQEKLSFL